MDESDLADAGLLVLDEVSMVNLEMLKDLKSYDVPILALGDPGQLPPIEGAGALTSGPPDALLTEIHRQAADNPIISYATRARNQVMIPYGTQGTSSHIHKESVTTRQVLDADQILTGKNTTRRDLNTRIRSLHGFSSPYPEVGEKLICLRNDIGIGIFNGMMAEVVAVGEILAHTIELELRLETQQSKPVRVRALRAHFDCYRDKDALKNVKWWMMRDAQEFDFGYAITVHKSQGSQWGNILLWDDKFLSWDRQERARWLYTAITRAAESITIAD
jgi:exodeoxyribonuclease-5